MAAGVSVLEMTGPAQASIEHSQSIRRESSIGLHSSRTRCRLKLSARKSSDYLLEAPVPQSIIQGKRSRDQLRQISTTTTTRACQLSHFWHANVASVFTVFTDEESKGFVFPECRSAPFRGTKRRRLGSDVDGPNTLEVGRKKRRLRSHLITSRLSRPFSQPATHILNRQGREVGDRRFRKMATTIDLARRAARLQATSYLRYSVMNCLRKRLGSVRRMELGQDHHGRHLVDHDKDTSAKAPWQQQVAKPDTKEQQQQQQQQPTSLAKCGVVLSISASAAPLEPTSVNLAHSAPLAVPACRLSDPVALPLPSADQAVTVDRIESRIHPTPPSPSLEQRQPLAWMYDDHEEDSFAFLHLEYEHTADDDLEHVYCDFDAIFGAKSSTPSEPQSPEDHTYEEYMDELDGISWRIR